MDNLQEGATAWDITKIARSGSRVKSKDLIYSDMFTSFVELHGDRLYGDDKAVIAGIAFLDGIPVTIIAQQKGKNYEESVKHRNGMMLPEGYRKALRLMKQAEKYKRPIICFVDNEKDLKKDDNVATEVEGQQEELFEEVEEIVTAGFTGCSDCCG